MALLTDRTLAASSAITPTTLIHIVTTGDTSQNPAGSSYKAELSQLSSILSSGSCIGGFYVDDLYACGSEITINNPVQSVGSIATGDLAFGFGFNTRATGKYSMAVGNQTSATTTGTYAGGFKTQATHTYAHTEGDSTRSTNNGQFVIGKYNDYTKAWAASAFIVGNGTSFVPADIFVVSNNNVIVTSANTFTYQNSPNLGYVLTSDSVGNSSWQPLSSLSGSSVISVTGITVSAYTATTNYSYYGVEFSGNTSIQIPNASGLDGYTIRIKDERGTAATYPITITPASATIDGNPFVTMAINYMSLTLVARNNNWWII